MTSLCARRACSRVASCRHVQTGELYCVPCARKINEHNPGTIDIQGTTYVLAVYPGALLDRQPPLPEIVGTDPAIVLRLINDVFLVYAPIEVWRLGNNAHCGTTATLMFKGKRADFLKWVEPHGIDKWHLASPAKQG